MLKDVGGVWPHLPLAGTRMLKDASGERVLFLVCHRGFIHSCSSMPNIAAAASPYLFAPRRLRSSIHDDALSSLASCRTRLVRAKLIRHFSPVSDSVGEFKNQA